MTVRTLGPAGTYSHRAARAVADGTVERGVVPVENVADEGWVKRLGSSDTEHVVYAGSGASSPSLSPAGDRVPSSLSPGV